MNALRRALFFLALLTASLLSGCGVLAGQEVQTQSPDLVNTQIAQTVIAGLTQIGPQVTQAPATGIPSWPPTETPTLALPSPTPTLVPPTATLPPAAPTATPKPCNWAEFVNDITVADGTVYAPGARFTKIWRLRNIGTCTWTTDYGLVFTRGDTLDARAVIPLPGSIRPGETVDLSVDMIAPTQPGRYRGYWMLRDGSVARFGLGANADKAFWVDIAVAAPSAVVFNFTAEYCNAAWSSGAGPLPCPGSQTDVNGFVARLDGPKLEYAQENETGLFTHPQWVPDGAISGRYPAFKVQAGDRFRAVTACMYGGYSCDVIFQLNYRVEGGAVKNLKTWSESYDEKPTRVDIDLSELAGKSVEFILTVQTHGPSNEDWAFWLRPTIWRSSFANTGASGSQVAEAARLFLARQLDVSASAVSVVSYESAEWTDTCLNINLSGQVCAPAITLGYKVLLNANGRAYEAHTDQTGNYVYWIAR